MHPRSCRIAHCLALALAALLGDHAQGAQEAPRESPAAAAEEAAPSPSPGPTAPGAGEPLPPLRNRFGETLRRPRILAFDGETFQVEHADGVASLPWDAMPEAWRRGFRRDPARATAARRVQEQRRQAMEERRDADQASRERETASTPTPAQSVVVERKMRLGDLYILPTIGGPEGELRIWRVSQTEVTFERRRYASQTVEKKLGFDSPRTLLFDDGRGCRVYYVDRPGTIEDRYTATVQFEYAPGREPPSGARE